MIKFSNLSFIVPAAAEWVFNQKYTAEVGGPYTIYRHPYTIEHSRAKKNDIPIDKFSYHIFKNAEILHFRGLFTLLKIANSTVIIGFDVPIVESVTNTLSDLLSITETKAQTQNIKIGCCFQCVDQFLVGHSPDMYIAIGNSFLTLIRKKCKNVFLMYKEQVICKVDNVKTAINKLAAASCEYLYFYGTFDNFKLIIDILSEAKN